MYKMSASSLLLLRVGGGSERITVSQVLPGLAISQLEEELRRTRQMNQERVCAWLIEQFQE